MRLKSQLLTKATGKNLFIVLLSIANAAYLFFEIKIAAANILQQDDFCFVARYHEHGIFGAVGWWYMNWQGRALPQLTTNIFAYIYEQTGSLLLYSLLLIAVFLLALTRLIKTYVFAGQVKNTSERLVIINLALLVFNTLLIFHFDASTFYWLNVSTMYFGGMAMLLLGISAIVRPSNSRWNDLLIVVCFLYAGCSSEHVGLMIVTGAVFCLVFQRYHSFQKQGDVVKTAIHKKTCIATICALIAFMFMYLAPGNTVRRGLFPAPSFVKTIQLMPNGLSTLAFNLLGARVQYLFLVFFPFLYAGNLFAVNQAENKPPMVYYRLMIYSLLALVVICIATVFLFGYAVGGQGATRALVHITTTCCIASAIVGFSFGAILHTSSIAACNLFALLSGGCLLLIAYNRIRVNLSPTLTYARQTHQRIMSLKNSGTPTKGILLLDSLHYDWRNILLHGEMGANKSDTVSYWINECTREALRLNYDIELRTSSREPLR